MSRLKNYISIVVFTASILGLFLSMAHSHSEGLECLYHVEDQHYTQNELLCPVCGITAFTQPVPQPSANSFIVFENNLIEAKDPFLSAHPLLLLSDRAPPEMA